MGLLIHPPSTHPPPPPYAEDHPEFKAELARIEDERVKKLAHAKHMLELGRENEEATYGIEKQAADSTLEFRKGELRERMIWRADDTIEELEEEGKERARIGWIWTPPPKILIHSFSPSSTHHHPSGHQGPGDHQDARRGCGGSSSGRLHQQPSTQDGAEKQAPGPDGGGD